MLTYDAIVVGGSYAGMSAALQLARARRNVLVIDAGQRRNRFAAHSHGFLTQDGIDPAVIAATGREQLVAYPSVTWLDAKADHAAKHGDGFVVRTGDNFEHSGSKLVLAPGVTDTLPDVPGLRERWGRSVFHCPYCHGYELGGGPVGVLAVGAVSLHQALLIPEWGPTTFFLNGAFEPSADDHAKLVARGVAIDRTPVAGIEGEAEVRLVDGRTIKLAGLFVASRTSPSSPLAEQLGCAHEEGPLGRFIQTDALKQTTVPGVFACGDAARAAGSVPLAVGDGAFTGASVHRSLIFG